MALNPKITEQGAKLKMTWTPDPSCQGYRLYVDGSAVSRTFKPDAFETTFDKLPGSHQYGVQKMNVVDQLEQVQYPVVTLPPPTGTRDASLWPFLSSSPWNMPMGSGADFDPETSPVWNAGGGVGLNSDNGWSIPVFIAKSSDPIMNIQSNTESGPFRVPGNAAPATQSDAHCCIIDEENDKLLETYGHFTRTGNTVTSTYALFNSVKDLGVYPEKGWHGTRAYGGSSLGGLIRQHEVISKSIPHALAAAVQRNAMNKNTPNGQAFVWPASNADSGWPTTYGSTGNLHMGSLVAIPPNVDLNSLGLNSLALAVARAMQDYGIYIVDAADAGPACVLYAEPQTGGSWDSTTRQGMTRAGSYLQVVVNNRADNVGGGGTPRKPLAPNFA